MASLTAEFRGIPGRNPVHLTIKSWGREINQYRHYTVGPDKGKIDKYEVDADEEWKLVGVEYEGPIMTCYAHLIELASDAREADRPKFNIGDIVFHVYDEKYSRAEILKLDKHPLTGFPAAEIKFLENLENRQKYDWIELEYLELHGDDDEEDEGRGIDVTAAMMTGMI